MTGALAVRDDQTSWTPEQRAALVQLGVDEASEGDLRVFLNYAQRTQLDPFSRQVYMVGRWDAKTRGKRWTIQVSIDGARIIAQRSGDYAGQVGPEWCGVDGQWHDVWLSSTPPVAARVGVLRAGFAQPLYAVALFKEYAGTTRDGGLTAMWQDKPALMIAKCAEALALRKAFPHDLSGLYTAEEMTRADESSGSLRVVRAASATSRPDAPVQGPAEGSTPPAGSERPSPERDGGVSPEATAPPSTVVDDAQIVDETTGEIVEAEPEDMPGRMRRAIFAIFHDLAERSIVPDDRDHRLAVCGYATGRDLASSTEIRDDELGVVLDVLDRLIDGTLTFSWHETSDGRPLFVGR